MNAVEATREGPVALVRMGVGGQRIRLTPALLEALGATLRRLAQLEDPTLIVLAGGPREFCLGADLDALRSAAAPAYLALGQEVVAALADSPVPTIAVVGGLALGGGFELALACDLRWAATRAAFGLPEAGHGLVPTWGAVAALARQLPHAVAWELLLGQRISGRRARDLGLVSRLFAGPDPLPQAMAAAAELALLGRETLIGLKRLWRGSGSPLLERQVCLSRLDAMRRTG